MEFRSIVPVSKNKNILDHHSKIFLLGSCFAENISEKLQYYKLDSTCNPFGIIFNAVSLENIIHRIATNKHFNADDIFEHNQIWNCFHIHSSLSKENQEEYLAHLNQILETAHHQLLHATHLIITFGTSWVYQLKETQQVVANCYKLPQENYSKVLLSQTQNVIAIQSILETVQDVNKNIKITFTVSPVRHIKDRFFENNVSKGNLLSAIYSIVDNDTISYFPSYEIMMDDLRDYRFYNSDLLHPSQTAIDYIWEKFTVAYFDTDSLQVMTEIDKIQKMLSHRPLHTNSTDFKKFTATLDRKIKLFTNKHPHIPF